MYSICHIPARLLLIDMDTFIEDLIRYNSWANQQIIAILSTNQAKVPDKCVGLLSHILNVHHIWNGKIYPALVTYEPWNVHPVEQLSEIDSLNTEVTFQTLKNTDATRPIEYQTKTGATFVNSAQEIFLQIITHSAYHRGQIATELRNANIEPGLTDYIYYKNAV
jgi:uncharacterized damage-inducible protein DinB